MQRLRPQHLLVPQEIVVGPQEVVLGPRLEALLVPHKQTVPSMSTMSTEIVEASHSGQHQVTPVPQVQPAPQRPPLLPHLRLKLGGAAFTIHTVPCFAMFRRSCTSGLPDGPPPTTLTAHLLLATTSYYFGASTDARRRPTTSTDAQRCSARLQLPANFFKGAGCFFMLCRRNLFAKFHSNLSIFYIMNNSHKDFD